MSDYGIGNDAWMAKVIIAQAEPMNVKAAVIDLIDRFNEESDTETFSAYEILDRLVQISAIGRYYPPEQKEFEDNISDIDKEIIQRFIEQMENLPTLDDEEDEETNHDE